MNCPLFKFFICLALLATVSCFQEVALNPKYKTLGTIKLERQFRQTTQHRLSNYNIAAFHEEGQLYIHNSHPADVRAFVRWSGKTYCGPTHNAQQGGPGFVWANSPPNSLGEWPQGVDRVDIVITEA